MPRTSRFQLRRLLVLGILATAASRVPAAPPVSTGQQRLAEVRAAAMREDIREALTRAAVVSPLPALRKVVSSVALAEGDLLTASTDGNNLLIVTFKNKASKVMEMPLEAAFIPRGIDVRPDGLVAIAAVSQVLLVDTATGILRVFTEPEGKRSKFGFANDVAFDVDGQLIIADMGKEPIGQLPADGRLWLLDPVTEIIEPLAERRSFSNPKLLAVNRQNQVYVVDGEAGPPISILAEGNWDVLYRLQGKNRTAAKPVFRDAGLQATAFDMDTMGRSWFGQVGEVVLLDGTILSFPCPIPPPFDFATGIVAAAAPVQMLDGVDRLPGDRVIWDIDAACGSSKRVGGSRIAASRGLARYAAPAEPQRD